MISPMLPRLVTRSAPRHRRRRPVARPRRGSALMLVLVMSLGLAALAVSAIYLSSNATILSKNFDRERDFRYAAEAALAMGKSRVNNDTSAVPDSGFAALTSNGPVSAADGTAIPGISVNLWVGRSGATNGQYGTYVSVVAEARDTRGSRFIRRLELAEENFAKFAYWSDKESNLSGTTIYFNNNDILYGPVWSNDVIHIASGRATFYDDVGTAKTIDGLGYGTFKRKVLQNQKPIELPTNENLSKMAGYAALGALSFDTPTNASDATAVRTRIEFKAVDLNGDGSLLGPDEGFVRVYESGAAALSDGTTASEYLRGDFTQYNCGDWHRFKLANGSWATNADGTPAWKFYPAAVHRDGGWLEGQLDDNNTMSAADADAHVKLAFTSIMYHTSSSPKKGQQAGAPLPRCFPGGDPHLAAVERGGNAGYTLAQQQIGGDSTTFTPSGNYGQWKPWSSPTGTARPVAATVRAARPLDAEYLYPLYRGLNPGSQGVVYANGTVALSGTLRGKVTVYATGSVVLVDDLKYAADAKNGQCLDMLGIIAGKNIWVADNALNTPQDVDSDPGDELFVNLDDTKDFNLMAVMMALNTAFGVERYDRASGPTNTNGCETVKNGRGCLYLNGGVIQAARGAVGQADGKGFTKRYSYDRCALQRSPPYFPTTGRFLDNRYYEVDPVSFDAGRYFEDLRSGK
ncbi:MAG TPA: hypothetical protein VKA84_07625 [Gemmatimonadaceae bacterium]|nr:hypothetical protein [Gemmatimonadaceae bacterium]